MDYFEKEPKYELTTEFIFSVCAKRLKERKLSLNLTDADIAGDYDRKVVNRIINNTRTRNNVYLIPPAYVYPLMNKLEIHNDYELFWGDAQDEEFIEEVFCNLLKDIYLKACLDVNNRQTHLEDSSYCCEAPTDAMINDAIIDEVLLDDVSYAKYYYTYVNDISIDGGFAYEFPIVPLAYVNNGEVDIHEGYDELDFDEILRENAMHRLFRNTRPIEMFRSFFKETNNRGENKGFSKLDKRLDNFVNKSLMPFLKDNMPDETSLGKRVHSIVSTDISNYVKSGYVNSQSTECGRCTSPEYDAVLKSLMSAGKDYINRIETLQAQLDEFCRKEPKNGRIVK